MSRTYPGGYAAGDGKYQTLYLGFGFDVDATSKAIAPLVKARDPRFLQQQRQLADLKTTWKRGVRLYKAGARSGLVDAAGVAAGLRAGSWPRDAFLDALLPRLAAQLSNLQRQAHLGALQDSAKTVIARPGRRPRTSFWRRLF